MSHFPLKRRWTKKPSQPIGVDWSNPLSSKLIGWHSFGFNDAKDLTGNFNSTLVNGQTVATSKGKALDFSPTDTYVYRNSTDIFGGYPFSVTVAIDANGVSAAYQAIVGNYDFNGSGQQDGFAIAVNATGVAEGYVRNGASFNRAIGTTNVTTSGKVHLVTYVAESSTSRKLYVDGILEATDTTSVTYPTGIDTLTYGWRTRSNDYTYDREYEGKLLEVLFHDKILSQAEIKSLHSNPYQLLQPQTQWIDITTGGVAPSFIPAWAMNSTLTQGIPGISFA